MSKTLLMAALTVFSVTAISAGGATAEPRFDREPIAREHRSAPIAEDFRFFAEGRPHVFHADGAESADSHVVKTGVWSSIKNGVKKAAKAVGTGAKRAATGVASNVKRAAKAVAKSPLVKPFKQIGSDVKKAAGKVVEAVKKFYRKKK